MQNPGSRSVLEIDLNLLRDNYQKIAKAVSPLNVIPVLKANAYGLGVRPIATALAESGASVFALAELSEALEITDLGIPLQILGAILEDDIPEIICNGIIAPVSDMEGAKMLSVEALKQKCIANCHVSVDTGMGRLGVLQNHAEAFIRELVKLPALNISGIYSHFPFAYEDYDFSCHQVTALIQLIDKLKLDGIEFETIHMANSDGIHNIKPSTQAPFNMVRTGINLYGCFDLDGRKTIELKEILTLKSKLVSVRELPWGSSIGYGRSYRLPKTMNVGTVAIGYADGLPLSMSNSGRMRINGIDCPIIGRVSMDYTTISLENVPDAKVGDEVICLGDGITVAEWAKSKGTITYEIICSIGNRVQRNYIN